MARSQYHSHFENGITQEFHSVDLRSYRLRTMFRDGEQYVGLSEYYMYKGRMYPGHRHHFLKYDAWKHCMDALPAFNIAVEQGEEIIID